MYISFGSPLLNCHFPSAGKKALGSGLSGNLSARARLTINPESVTGDSRVIHALLNAGRFCMDVSVISDEISITIDDTRTMARK